MKLRQVEPSVHCKSVYAPSRLWNGHAARHAVCSNRTTLSSHPSIPSVAYGWNQRQQQQYRIPTTRASVSA